MSLPPLARSSTPMSRSGTPVTPSWDRLSPALRLQPLRGDGSPKALQTDHLREALELALAVSKRYQREGRNFTAEELRLAKELGAVFGAQSASTPQNNNGQSASASPLKLLEGRKAVLLEKLRKATTAQSIYQQMVASQGDVTHLTEFAMKCTALDNVKDIAHLLAEELEKEDKKSRYSVYLVEPVDGLFLVNPEDGSPFLQLSVGGIRSKDVVSTSFESDAPFSFIPIHVEADILGVAIPRDGSNELAISSFDRSEQQLQRLEAIAGIAALSLKNCRLYDTLKWHVEKAEAMLEMAKQLSSDNLREEVLVKSIINTARSLTEADRCSVFLVKGEQLHAYFDDGNSIKMPLQTGIAGAVATTGRLENIADVYQDARFNRAIDKATGYRTKSLLCMPVEYEGTVVAVAQLINKRPRGEVERTFTTRDQDLFKTFSTMIAVCLRNCRVNADLVQEREKTTLLLQAAATLSESDIRDVNDTVDKVIHGAKHLLGADRATLFLIDREHGELYSQMADDVGGKEIRFPVGRGIAGAVATSGNAENIKDAYLDARFNQEIDKQVGYRTQSILCQPIMCRGEILAVAQLVNKINPRDGAIEEFTAQDEHTFTQFATFAGISLSNAQLLSFAVTAGEEAMLLSQTQSMAFVGERRSTTVSLKRTAVPQATLAAVRQVALPTQALEASKTHAFSLFSLRQDFGDRSSDAAVALVVSLLLSTGLPDKFDCGEETLMRFVCACRQCYRKVPYHNFYHVVDACQTVYTYLYVGGGCEVLSEVEAFTLLITTLAHDLDHMGLNNSFHLKTDSPLGILSSSSGNRSVLEVHHCNVAVEILEDPLSNVFGGLPPADQAVAYKLLIDTILATDMARHAEHLEMLKTLPRFDKADPAHRKIAAQILMKAADISNVTKPFDISRQWAVCVTEEFHQQGDKEKERGVVDVLPMFDRAKAGELANGQIGFIEAVARPFFQATVKMFPKMSWTVEQLNENVGRWKQLLARRSSEAV